MDLNLFHKTPISYSTVNDPSFNIIDLAQWLRRCVTNREVASSRPDEVNDFYQFT
jgi:hypothetical protein